MWETKWKFSYTGLCIDIQYIILFYIILFVTAKFWINPLNAIYVGYGDEVPVSIQLHSGVLNSYIGQ